MLESFFAVFDSQHVKVDSAAIDRLISALTDKPPAITITINESRGGVVSGFAKAVAELEELPTKIVFNGRCGSACTMLLKLSDRACATENAMFYFHSVRARYADGRETRFDKEAEDRGNKILMDHYPEKIKLAIIANGGLPFDDLLYVKGTDILPVCP